MNELSHNRVMKAYYVAKANGQNATFAAGQMAKREGWSNEQIKTLAKELKKI